MGTEENEPEGQSRIAAFRQGLRELGWVDGRNIQIEYRWSSGPRQAAYAAELVAMGPEVIVTNGTPFLDAVHKGTRSIPIVFVLSNDPVGLGHIASMAKPGGNITGFTFMELSLIGKWLDMLKANRARRQPERAAVQPRYDALIIFPICMRSRPPRRR